MQLIRGGVLAVGSIYENAVDGRNPSLILGYGTWSALGAGRVTVGYDALDADFDEASAVGGEKAHTLSIDEIPSHSHIMDVSHSGASSGSIDAARDANGANADWSTRSAGGGLAHNNLQPFIVVFRWVRSA